jgi:AmmeMemoRadiSam system protein B
MKRKAAVAGTFYYENPQNLIKSIEDNFLDGLGVGYIPKFNNSNNNINHDTNSNKDRINKKNIYGLIAPHAGHYYSGSIASHAYATIVENGFPETFIILCPNHTGFGNAPISVSDEELWETPLGEVEIDKEFAENLISQSEFISNDSYAHLREHSCEVHLPFLQYFSKDFKIVPIVMSVQNLESIDIVSNALINTIESTKRSVTIIGSSDFSHYISGDSANELDKLVIDEIANFNPLKILDLIEKYNISICGFGPIIVTMIVSNKLGSNKFNLLKYGNSGDVSGDYSSVVAYLSGTFE